MRRWIAGDACCRLSDLNRLRSRQQRLAGEISKVTTGTTASREMNSSRRRFRSEHPNSPQRVEPLSQQSLYPVARGHR